MSRKLCKAYQISENGKEYCQGFAGHHWHWYWAGECKVVWRNIWRNTKKRKHAKA